jgi:hypothetical protein
LDTNIHGILKPKGGPWILARRVHKITERFDGDTQRVRGQLILDLGALQELCSDNAVNTHPKKWKEKQSWARLAAYISQVINSIAREYDVNKIKEILVALEEKVYRLEQLQRRNKRSGKKGRKTRKSG